MTSQYAPGNRFAQRVTIADAAVAWQGLSTELQTNVVLNTRGLPELAGCQDLLERAEGILIAVQEGLISGAVHTEDGYPLLPAQMRLDRPSLATWIAAIEKNVGIETAKKLPQGEAPVEKLLEFKQLFPLLEMSASKLKRLIKSGTFPGPSYSGPNRWPASVVNEHLASKIITRVSSDSKASNDDI